MADNALECLEAKQAITDVLVRYCRAMDRNDAALGYSVWHADGVASYPPAFVGSGHAFVDRVCAMHRERYTAHVHRLATPLVVVDAAVAESEACIHAVLWSSRDGAVYRTDIFGRYLDRWSRRDGAWRIDRREYLHEMDEVRLIVPGPLVRDRGTMGQRDPSDLSYTLERLAAVDPGAQLPRSSHAPV